jgi:hypothetical protein
MYIYIYIYSTRTMQWFEERGFLLSDPKILPSTRKYNKDRYVYTYIHMSTNIYIYIRIYVYMHKFIYVYIYICIYAYTHTYIHSYIHTYIYIYIYRGSKVYIKQLGSQRDVDAEELLWNV